MENTDKLNYIIILKAFVLTIHHKQSLKDCSWNGRRLTTYLTSKGSVSKTLKETT